MGEAGTDRRVVLADDHAPMRHLVHTILADAGYEVVRSVATAGDAVTAAADLHPDLCLLDVQMPGDGIVAAQRISAEVPGTAVVMLTASSDADVVTRALLAGARGVLSKDVDLLDLAQALDRVLGTTAA